MDTNQGSWRSVPSSLRCRICRNSFSWYVPISYHSICYFKTVIFHFFKFRIWKMVSNSFFFKFLLSQITNSPFLIKSNQKVLESQHSGEVLVGPKHSNNGLVWWCELNIPVLESQGWVTPWSLLGSVWDPDSNIKVASNWGQYPKLTSDLYAHAWVHTSNICDFWPLHAHPWVHTRNICSHRNKKK